MSRTRAWSVSRAGVYRFLKRTTSPAIPRRRGPTGPCPDADLADHIRREIEASDFHGEGYRKLCARLRVAGVRSSPRRARPIASGTTKRRRNVCGQDENGGHCKYDPYRTVPILQFLRETQHPPADLISARLFRTLRSVAMRFYSHLSDDERDQIAILWAAGRSMGAIARALGRAKTTISKELPVARVSGLRQRPPPARPAPPRAELMQPNRANRRTSKPQLPILG